MHKSLKGCPHISDAQYFESIKKRTAVNEKGCWIWQGFTFETGYGSVGYRGKNMRVHRLMFMLAKGEIGAGMDICHSCDNPGCVNPDHLWQGTPRENMLDASRKKRLPTTQKTHCPRGHEYSAENTRILRTSKHTIRQCIICNRARNRISSGWSKEEAYSVAPIPKNVRTARRTFEWKPRRSALLNAAEVSK